MTDREAFISNICANPTDDTPRLVFADWLEENGEEEWAKFIRWQIGLAKTPPYLDGQKIGFVHKGDLAKAVPSGWLALNFGKGYDLQPVLVFNRGFGSLAYCSMPDWITHGPRLVAEWPLEWVDIVDAPLFQETIDIYRWLTSFAKANGLNYPDAINIAMKFVTTIKVSERPKVLSTSLINWARRQAIAAPSHRTGRDSP